MYQPDGIMKITFLVLVTTFVASVALAQEDAKTVAAPATEKTYLVQVDGATVAILPPGLKREISVECSGNATYDKETGTANFTHAVKLVANVPDQAAITITGENLTLLPQK